MEDLMKQEKARMKAHEKFKKGLLRDFGSHPKARKAIETTEELCQNRSEGYFYQTFLKILA